MIKTLADVLTALSQFLTQAHLSACNNAYASHLLTEKLQKRVAEDIDRIKELYIASTGERSIANAQESLKQAELTLRAFLQDKPQETTADLLLIAAEICNQAHDTAADCAEFYAGEAKEARFSKAIQTAAEDICERRARDFYLLMTEASCK
jgi:DNA-binding ferritin-like protein|nr:MAG TPA: hypothetical protein [Caudoviricetes sp.]